MLVFTYFALVAIFGFYTTKRCPKVASKSKVERWVAWVGVGLVLCFPPSWGWGLLSRCWGSGVASLPCWLWGCGGFGAAAPWPVLVWRRLVALALAVVGGGGVGWWPGGLVVPFSSGEAHPVGSMAPREKRRFGKF